MLVFYITAWLLQGKGESCTLPLSLNVAVVQGALPQLGHLLCLTGAQFILDLYEHHQRATFLAHLEELLRVTNVGRVEVHLRLRPHVFRQLVLRQRLLILLQNIIIM